MIFRQERDDLGEIIRVLELDFFRLEEMFQGILVNAPDSHRLRSAGGQYIFYSAENGINYEISAE